MTNTIEEICGQTVIDRLVGGAKRLIRRDISLFRAGFCLALLTVGAASLEGKEFVELLEERVVDACTRIGQGGVSPVRDDEMATPRRGYKSCLLEVGFGPVYAVSDNGLLAAGEHFFALFRRKAEFV